MIYRFSIDSLARKMAGGAVAIVYTTFFLAVGAIILSVICLIQQHSGGGSSGGGGGGVGGGGFINRTGAIISLYDDRTQTLSGAGQWTTIKFNHDISGINSHPFFVVDGLSGTLTANTGLERTLFFVVYLSIQAQFNGATQATSLACKACNLRYAIRAEIQPGGIGDFQEIAGSLTYSSGHNFFLAKEFFIDAVDGDVFRFQFNSLCGDLALVPLPFVHTTNSSLGEFPASATLLVF